MTFVNPEPLAPFADVIAAGEAELLVPALVEAFADEGSRDRARLLERLTPAPRLLRAEPLRRDLRRSRTGRGHHAQSPDPMRRRSSTRPPSRRPIASIRPRTSIFTPDTEFGSRLLIEVVRGCANLCRFCWAGYNYLPVRPFSHRPHPRDCARRRGRYANRIGLVSIALCDHPDIEQILTQPDRDGLRHQSRVAAAR